MTNFLFYFIRLWQKTRLLRELLQLSQCRFYPSCSDYFLESVRVNGLVNGLLLSLKRLFRCHPLCMGGIDEVRKV